MDVANGTVCPVCNGALIPGLDACYCKSCRVYYHTPTGLKMLKERQQKKLTRTKTTKAKQSTSSFVLNDLSLFESSSSEGYSHHDFENFE